METFITDNFMLQNKIAEELYHEHASRMPIIDFHSHLPPKNIADNSAYPSLTDVWLGGDHYKWRAMRSDGVDEQHITGQSSDWEKFQAWAQTVPHTIGNPLYHWTHLELLRYFKIDKLLNPASAAEIYDAANGYLLQKDFRVRPLLEKMQVEVICTTDDPVDSLEHHQKIAEDSLNSLKVVPTFRPDRALAAENPADFNAYLDTLGEKAGFEIDDYDTFIEALEKRHAFFHDNGCRSSDHALVSPIAENFTLSEVKSIFKKSSERNPSRCIGTAQITNGGACRIGKNELQACLGDAAPHRRNSEQ